MGDCNNLMELLLKAGYPKEEMYNHYSDLYVYVNEISTNVITKWCKDNNYGIDWHCPRFTDNITGREMYDCAFCLYE